MKNFRFYVVAVAFILSGVIFSCSKSKQEEVLDLSETKTESLIPGTNADSSIDGQNAGSQISGSNADAQPTDSAYILNPSADQSKEKNCFVYVCGAVMHPDVYELLPGRRIVDAVQAAGGFADDAAKSYLNLADFVADGMKIYVPTKEELENAEKATAVSGEPETFAGAGGGAISFSKQKDMQYGYTSGAGDLSGAEDASGAAGKININTATAAELKTLNGIGDARAADIISYRNANGNFQTIEDIMQVPGIKSAAFAKIREYITVE